MRPSPYIYIYTQGVALRIDPKFDLLGLFCFSEILCFCGFLKEKNPKIDPKLGQRVSKLRPASNLNQNMPNLRATSEQIQGKKRTQSKTCFRKPYWYCRNKMIFRKNGPNFLGQCHPKITIFGKRQVKGIPWTATAAYAYIQYICCEVTNWATFRGFLMVTNWAT